MELIEDIIGAISRDEPVRVVLASGEAERLAEAIDLRCLRALERIQAAVSENTGDRACVERIKLLLDGDDGEDTPEDFARVEEIIEALEGLGSHGGFRHDF